jgi:hypothetical protein
LAAALPGPGWVDAAAPIAVELRAARALPKALGDDPELAPWAAAASAHATAGLAALRLIQQATPLEPADGDGRRTVPPEPEAAMHHAFALTYTWLGARADEHVVYGPRFAVYSAVVQLPDGVGPALDVRAALREDANVIDRLCRLALEYYEAWVRNPDAHREPVTAPLPFPDPRLGDPS